MNISNDIKYVGVNDHEIDLFEGQYDVPCGMSYNSYVILDDEIAVMDSVDRRFGDEWLKNIKGVLGEKEPSYLIVQHMEPDHSANIAKFLSFYRNAKVVATDKSINMISQFFGEDYADRRIIVKEGDALSLGKHTLTFLTAPMVHWPEVMVTFDSCDEVLFSADAFGVFGALDKTFDWESEARRYYIGIVGKYGMQVQRLLAKLSDVKVKTICPLHGPVLRGNLDCYIELYKKWSSYTPESDEILIAYTSVYGNTAAAVKLLCEKLEAENKKYTVYDLARSDMSKAVADAFRCSKLVLATTTYNGEIFPFMREFINELKERGFCNRRLGIIENGSWAPMAAKIIVGAFEKSKGIELCENVVTVKSALNSESILKIEALAKEI